MTHRPTYTILADLPVHHCQTRAITIAPESDVFDALGHLKDVAAVVVVQNRKPIGIVTYYDATHFFRNVSEGLMYVEDIEVTLRQYIEATFPNDDKRTAALIQTFGADKQNPGEPRKPYERMSFYDHIQFITAENNWTQFEPYLQPQGLFRQLMEHVRVIRNQLAHFRDELSPVQMSALLHARDWLAGRPKAPSSRPLAQAPLNAASIPLSAPQHQNALLTKGKYGPLQAWLLQQPAATEQVQLSFEQIEQILGDTLPDSARTHQAWWSNGTVGHSHAQAWLGAGWRVQAFDLNQSIVAFERYPGVNYQLFFHDVLQGLHELRPSLAPATTPGPRNHLSFGSGVRGFRYGWAFTRNHKFRIELYCDTGDKEVTERIFDELQKQQKAIEDKLGAHLSWERLDHRRACRIAWEQSGAIADPPEQLAELKQWAITTMPTFVDTMQPYLHKVEASLT
ncbi:MAG: DUF4268 domain-containing protein [Caldilinea sp. CFX5]|nr:DUF4268 domain-containing protein [Caldilinea sp. CFX5]